MHDFFDDVVLTPFLESPAGDELAIAHVGFFDVLAEFNAPQLQLQAVPDLRFVNRLADVERGHQTEFDEFRIHDVVHGYEIGPGFLERRRVALQRFLRRAHAGIDLAGRMANYLVHVDVEQRAAAG